MSLGIWQIVRLNWKLDLINSIENSLKSEPVSFAGNDPVNFKKISFEGIIDNSKIIYLYSLNENGEPGFDIVNPINIENKSYLINRGWIPRDFKSNKYITSETNFKGILKLKSKFNYFKPDNDIKTNYWFTLNDEDLLAYTGKNFSPFIINDISNVIKGFSQEQIEDLERDGKANFVIKDTNVTIDLGDVEINYKDIEGLSVASGDGTTIALDLKLDENLINEGIARELVNRIQNIRKSKDLEVTDKIEINIKKSEKLEIAIKSNLDYIKGETLANKLYFSENFDSEGETLEFDDIKTVITVNKI